MFFLVSFQKIDLRLVPSLLAPDLHGSTPIVLAPRSLPRPMAWRWRGAHVAGVGAKINGVEVGADPLCWFLTLILQKTITACHCRRHRRQPPSIVPRHHSSSPRCPRAGRTMNPIALPRRRSLPVTRATLYCRRSRPTTTPCRSRRPLPPSVAPRHLRRHAHCSTATLSLFPTTGRFHAHRHPVVAFFLELSTYH